MFNFLLDIEFNTIKKNKNLLRYLKSTNTDLLVSWHNFKQTPNASILKKQYLKKKKKSKKINVLLLLWKCLRPPLIRGELIGSQRSLDQKEQKS